MQLRHGIHAQLEDKATEMLLADMADASTEEKSLIITPWKAKHRARREIMVPSGTPDPSLRRGQFSRCWNSEMPHLNSYDGLPNPARICPAEFDEQGFDYLSGLSPQMQAVIGIERVDD